MAVTAGFLQVLWRVIIDTECDRHRVIIDTEWRVLWRHSDHPL